MATCPECGSRERMSCTPTGGLVATGPAYVAGVNLKVAARDEYRLECACGWYVTGYIREGYFYVAASLDETRTTTQRGNGHGDVAGTTRSAGGDRRRDARG